MYDDDDDLSLNLSRIGGERLPSAAKRVRDRTDFKRKALGKPVERSFIVETAARRGFSNAADATLNNNNNNNNAMYATTTSNSINANATAKMVDNRSPKDAPPSNGNTSNNNTFVLTDLYALDKPSAYVRLRDAYDQHRKGRSSGTAGSDGATGTKEAKAASGTAGASSTREEFSSVAAEPERGEGTTRYNESGGAMVKIGDNYYNLDSQNGGGVGGTGGGGGASRPTTGKSSASHITGRLSSLPLEPLDRTVVTLHPRVRAENPRYYRTAKPLPGMRNAEPTMLSDPLAARRGGAGYKEGVGEEGEGEGGVSAEVPLSSSEAMAAAAILSNSSSGGGARGEDPNNSGGGNILNFVRIVRDVAARQEALAREGIGADGVATDASAASSALHQMSRSRANNNASYSTTAGHSLSHSQSAATAASSSSTFVRYDDRYAPHRMRARATNECFPTTEACRSWRDGPIGRHVLSWVPPEYAEDAGEGAGGGNNTKNKCTPVVPFGKRLPDRKRTAGGLAKREAALEARTRADRRLLRQQRRMERRLRGGNGSGSGGSVCETSSSNSGSSDSDDDGFGGDAHLRSFLSPLGEARLIAEAAEVDVATALVVNESQNTLLANQSAIAPGRSPSIGAGGGRERSRSGTPSPQQASLNLMLPVHMPPPLRPVSAHSTPAKNSRPSPIGGGGRRGTAAAPTPPQTHLSAASYSIYTAAPMLANNGVVSSNTMLSAPAAVTGGFHAVALRFRDETDEPPPSPTGAFLDIITDAVGAEETLREDFSVAVARESDRLTEERRVLTVKALMVQRGKDSAHILTEEMAHARDVSSTFVALSNTAAQDDAEAQRALAEEERLSRRRMRAAQRRVEEAEEAAFGFGGGGSRRRSIIAPSRMQSLRGASDAVPSLSASHLSAVNNTKAGGGFVIGGPTSASPRGHAHHTSNKLLAANHQGHRPKSPEKRQGIDSDKENDDLGDAPLIVIDASSAADDAGHHNTSAADAHAVNTAAHVLLGAAGGIGNAAAANDDGSFINASPPQTPRSARSHNTSSAEDEGGGFSIYGVVNGGLRPPRLLTAKGGAPNDSDDGESPLRDGSHRPSDASALYPPTPGGDRDPFASALLAPHSDLLLTSRGGASPRNLLHAAARREEENQRARQLLSFVSGGDTMARATPFSQSFSASAPAAAPGGGNGLAASSAFLAPSSLASPTSSSSVTHSASAAVSYAIEAAEKKRKEMFKDYALSRREIETLWSGVLTACGVLRFAPLPPFEREGLLYRPPSSSSEGAKRDRSSSLTHTIDFDAPYRAYLAACEEGGGAPLTSDDLAAKRRRSTSVLASVALSALGPNRIGGGGGDGGLLDLDDDDGPQHKKGNGGGGGGGGANSPQRPMSAAIALARMRASAAVTPLPMTSSSIASSAMVSPQPQQQQAAVSHHTVPPNLSSRPTSSSEEQQQEGQVAGGRRRSSGAAESAPSLGAFIGSHGFAMGDGDDDDKVNKEGHHKKKRVGAGEKNDGDEDPASAFSNARTALEAALPKAFAGKSGAWLRRLYFPLIYHRMLLLKALEAEEEGAFFNDGFYCGAKKNANAAEALAMSTTLVGTDSPTPNATAAARRGTVSLRRAGAGGAFDASPNPNTTTTTAQRQGPTHRGQQQQQSQLLVNDMPFGPRAVPLPRYARGAPSEANLRNLLHAVKIAEAYDPLAAAAARSAGRLFYAPVPINPGDTSESSASDDAKEIKEAAQHRRGGGSCLGGDGRTKEQLLAAIAAGEDLLAAGGNSDGGEDSAAGDDNNNKKKNAPAVAAKHSPTQKQRLRAHIQQRRGRTAMLADTDRFGIERAKAMEGQRAGKRSTKAVARRLRLERRRGFATTIESNFDYSHPFEVAADLLREVGLTLRATQTAEAEAEAFEMAMELAARAEEEEAQRLLTAEGGDEDAFGALRHIRPAADGEPLSLFTFHSPDTTTADGADTVQTTHQTTRAEGGKDVEEEKAAKVSLAGRAGLSPLPLRSPREGQHSLGTARSGGGPLSARSPRRRLSRDEEARIIAAAKAQTRMQRRRERDSLLDIIYHHNEMQRKRSALSGGGALHNASSSALQQRHRQVTVVAEDVPIDEVPMSKFRTSIWKDMNRKRRQKNVSDRREREGKEAFTERDEAGDLLDYRSGAKARHRQQLVELCMGEIARKFGNSIGDSGVSAASFSVNGASSAADALLTQLAGPAGDPANLTTLERDVIFSRMPLDETSIPTYFALPRKGVEASELLGGGGGGVRGGGGDKGGAGGKMGGGGPLSGVGGGESVGNASLSYREIEALAQQFVRDEINDEVWHGYSEGRANAVMARRAALGRLGEWVRQQMRLSRRLAVPNQLREAARQEALREAEAKQSAATAAAAAGATPQKGASKGAGGGGGGDVPSALSPTAISLSRRSSAASANASAVTFPLEAAARARSPRGGGAFSLSPRGTNKASADLPSPSTTVANAHQPTTATDQQTSVPSEGAPSRRSKSPSSRYGESRVGGADHSLLRSSQQQQHVVPFAPDATGNTFITLKEHRRYTEALIARNYSDGRAPVPGGNYVNRAALSDSQYLSKMMAKGGGPAGNSKSNNNSNAPQSHASGGGNSAVSAGAARPYTKEGLARLMADAVPHPSVAYSASDEVRDHQTDLRGLVAKARRREMSAGAGPEATALKFSAGATHRTGHGGGGASTISAIKGSPAGVSTTRGGRGGHIKYGAMKQSCVPPLPTSATEMGEIVERFGGRPSSAAGTMGASRQQRLTQRPLSAGGGGQGVASSQFGGPIKAASTSVSIAGKLFTYDANFASRGVNEDGLV